MRVQDSDHRAAEYFIDWTYALALHDAAGKPVAHAVVRIDDAHHRPAFIATTDEKGTISAVLTELHVFNSADGVTRERDTPHTVSVTAGACRSTFFVTADHTLAEARELDCH